MIKFSWLGLATLLTLSPAVQAMEKIGESTSQGVELFTKNGSVDQFCFEKSELIVKSTNGSALTEAQKTDFFTKAIGLINAQCQNTKQIVINDVHAYEKVSGQWQEKIEQKIEVAQNEVIEKPAPALNPQDLDEVKALKETKVEAESTANAELEQKLFPALNEQKSAEKAEKSVTSLDEVDEKPAHQTLDEAADKFVNSVLLHWLTFAGLVMAMAFGLFYLMGKARSTIESFSKGVMAGLIVLLFIPAYILPYYLSNSSTTYFAYSVSGVLPIMTLLHIGLYLAIVSMVFYRLDGLKRLAAVLPLTAMAFDLIPVLSSIPFVPTLLMVVTLVVVLILAKSNRNADNLENFNNYSSKEDLEDDLKGNNSTVMGHQVEKESSESDSNYKSRLFKIGAEYEESVAKHYEQMGYKVIRNGNKKFEDKGVDLIAFNPNYEEGNPKSRLVLIQCKNWINSMIKRGDSNDIFATMDNYARFHLSTEYPEAYNYMIKNNPKYIPQLHLVIPNVTRISHNARKALYNFNEKSKQDRNTEYCIAKVIRVDS